MASAQPYEAYPISKQYPPVARIGEGFAFQLSNDTYKSSRDKTSQISYQVYDLPSWLSFDSQQRIISGTPTKDDWDSDKPIKNFKFILEGTDAADNSALNKTYELVVTNRTSLSVSSSFNLLSLLKNYGYTNGMDALKLSPGDVFNVTFERDTFTTSDSDSIVAYYGLSQEYHAPLPSWLFFDENNLKFSGTAPVVNSEIAPEMDYSFSLVATDVAGYSGVEVNFRLVMGAHQLTTSIENTMLINVTDSGSFSYDIPLNYVYLDGQEISNSDISSIELFNAPSWVTLDNQTLSGNLPNSSVTGNFSVAIHDVHQDVVYLNFAVESTQKLFAISSLSNVNATRGEWFQYFLLPSQFTNYDDTDVSIDFNSSDSHDWLSFKSSNLTLSGKVPRDFNSLSVGVVAKEKANSQKLSFKIIGVNGKNHYNSTNTTTTTSSATSSTASSITSTSHSATSDSQSTPTSEITPLNSNLKKGKNNKTVAIVCGVVIPVVLIIVLVLLFLLFWRRKRSAAAKEKQDEEKSSGADGVQMNGTTNNKNPFVSGAVVGAASPFDDDGSISDTSTAKRLGAINAMKLDENASSSDETTFDDDEKRNSLSSDLYRDAMQTRSTDMLLHDNDADDYYDPKLKSSSVYFNSEPTNRKSWRFSTNPSNGNVRESYNSLNTVSTAELLNTEIADNKNIPKDPKKSSLGLRDSVFWDTKGNPSLTKSGSIGQMKNDEHQIEGALPVLRESPSKLDHESYISRTSSSSDTFIPVKQGNGYRWVDKQNIQAPAPPPVRKRSTKRLVNLPNKSGVNVGDADMIQGQEPERT